MPDETSREPSPPWRLRLPALLPSAAGLALAPRYDLEAGVLTGLAAEIKAERQEAPRLWAELSDLSPPRRALLVRNESRFHTWGLLDFLVRMVRAMAPREAFDALALAQLALDVADRLAARLGPDLAAEYRATALAAAANAARHAGLLGEAAETLDEAFEALREGSQDLFVESRLFVDRGQIAADQGRLHAAAAAFGRAARLLERLGNSRGAARVRVQQADAVGPYDPARAVVILRRALPRLDLAVEPRLELLARHRLIWFHNDAGHPWTAARLLDGARGLYERHGDALVRLHRRWLEGRILRNSGEIDSADRALYGAYLAFAEIGHAQDLILCALDLVELYCIEGAEQRAERLVEELGKAFEDWGFHPDALTLWRRALTLDSREQFAHLALLVRESWPRLTADAEPAE